MKKKNREIFCHFLQKKSEGLDELVYYGKIGKKIYQKISKIAWNKWIQHQTKIINEKKLNLSSTEDIKKIEKEMVNFLFFSKK